MRIGYARVSTPEQSCTLQREALEQNGCVKVFAEVASGAKAARPALTAALEYVRAGDTLVVWRLDRLGRSLGQLMVLMQTLQSRQIGCHSLVEAIDTTTATGQFFFQITGAFAELERNLIRERTRAGLASARQRGRCGGRPKAMDAETFTMAVQLYQARTSSVQSICTRLGIARRTFYRYLATRAVKEVKFRPTHCPQQKIQHIPDKSGITFSMPSPPPNVNAISDLATGNGNDATPFSQQSVVLTKQAYIELTWQANYWQAQHARSVEREAALTAKVASLEATVRDLTQRLYGTKSETSAAPDEAAESSPSRPRHRGQQPGSKGHGRSERSALLVVPEMHDLSPAQACCPACGEAFAPFPGTEESTIIEVQVQAHLRRIQRRRYQKMCGCPQVPGIMTAPPAPRVLPKSPLGVSLWTTVLLDKYLYGRPTYRLCEQLTPHGVPLSQGTLTDGLQKIAVLFEPVMTKLYERQMGEKRFHGDETRWEVFEDVAGKTGHRWYLWVMQSASVVFYRMAPGRGADVPQGHFAKLHKDLVDVVLVCDRYSAYKCLAKTCDELILAFCWAHVRRDFLKAARSWPDLERWMFIWVDDIRELYRLNAARLEAWDETLPLDLQPLDFTERHQALETKLSTMQACCEAHLQEPTLHLAQHKVLSSLHNHWAGLTIFVGHPEVAMDNNTAERTLRTPVVGRKNYYGSGSVWSAHLAARMFSVLQTVLLWGLNPHHWLSAFLQACADHGSTCPPDLRAFLPWQMTPERREELTRPAPGTLSPLTDQAQEGDKTEVVDTS